MPIIGIVKRADNPKKKQILYKSNNWGADTTEDIIKNIEFHLSKIPDHCRRDLFFTIAETEDREKDRRLLQQKFMPFDIDNVDQARKEETAEAVCSYLKIKFSDVYSCFTGGGLHIGIFLKNPIKSVEELKSMQPAYASICAGITDFLKKRDIPGHADPQMLSEGRLFRLPGSINTKYGTAGIEVDALNLQFKELDFDLSTISGIGAITETHKKEPHPDYVAMVPQTVDPQAVKDGCLFLKRNELNPETLSEPEWFADIGVRSFFKDGEKELHEIHSKYPGYSKEETEEKIRYVRENQTGPRKCESIQRSTGFDCTKCPNYKRVVTPLQIKGKDFIATETTGFRTPIPQKPAGQWPICYPDLLKKFEKEYTYFTAQGNERVNVYTGTHWKDMGDSEITSWMHHKVNPYTKKAERMELVHYLKDNIRRTQEALKGSTFKRINFQNGVYDVESRTLLAHSPDFGFRNILPFSFDPEAKSPRFDRFLKEILPGDDGNQKAILEYIGYGLFNDDCWLQKALFFIGEGSNGKSTLLDVIKELCGGRPNSISMPFHAVSEKENARVQLEDALFCISEESKATSLLESEMFKMLVSGGEVDAKKLYEDTYTFYNRAKFIMSFNNITASRDKTKALYRRIRMIEFTQTFAVDDTIKGELKKELAGIFNRVLEAYERLHEQRKLTDSPFSDRLLENFKRDNDVCFTFLQDHFQVTSDENAFKPKQEIYQEFSEYYESNGFSRSNKPDVKSFVKAVKSFMGNSYLEKRRGTRSSQKWGFVYLEPKDID